MSNETNQKTPLVSVIMGVYNQYNQLELIQAVNSILTQTLTDFEFIIYDDGSDGEPAEYIRRLVDLDKRIRVERSEKNKGLAYSLNKCISKAKGKYIARMDADDISLPERLQKEYDFLESHPEYSWVGTNAQMFEHENIWGSMEMAEVPNNYNFLPFSPFVHPSVMFRRELLESSGGYEVSEETLRCEDYELFMRLYIEGFRGYNIRENLFLYRQGIAAHKKRTLKTRLNEAIIRAKYFPKLGVPKYKQYLYISRPLITAVIPYFMIAQYKKIRIRRSYCDRFGEENIHNSLDTDVSFVYGLGVKRIAE